MGRPGRERESAAHVARGYSCAAMWKKATPAPCRQTTRLWGLTGVHKLGAEMIIACPACATRYVVPDSAVGPEGRTVRCAKCKHSWFQDGPELVEPMAAAYAAPVAKKAEPSPPRPARSDTRTETPGAQPQVPPAWVDENEIEDEFTGPRAPPPEPATDTPAFDEVPPPTERADTLATEQSIAVDEVSQFDHEPPFRPRRNWVRWLTLGAGAFAVLALAAVAAMSVLGTPSWLPIEKPLFGADPGLKVEFPASEQERRTLPNGAEFFGARVVVKNEARETKRVPPLLIVLRDARERVVYSWELVPPQRTLAPGEAMTINEAMTDVPKSAVYADIGWAPR